MIGTFEKIGSVLGQDQDNFAMVPLNQFLRLAARDFSLTLEHSGSRAAPRNFERAQDEATVILRLAGTFVQARTTISLSAPKKATSRYGSRSAARFSPCF